MALYDYDKNGKIDTNDDFIEYNLVNDSKKNKEKYNNTKKPTTESKGWGGAIFLGFIIFAILYFLCR